MRLGRLLLLLLLRTRLLALLDLLLLLGVFLLQLLRLPLVLLFQLLLPRVIRPLLRLPLMFLVLPLLQLLVFLVLLLLQFLLLLLIFLVELRVSGVRSCGSFMLRNILGVDNIVGAVAAVVLGTAWIVDRSSLSGRHCSAAAEVSRSLGGSHRRPAVIL